MRGGRLIITAYQKPSHRDGLQINSQRHLFPADLAAFVLFFQPAHQRFEVFHHRASGDVFAGRFLQNFAPIFRAAFFQNVVQPRTDFLVIGVIT